MDGTLDDPLWQQATPITNFLQREPYEGQAPTEPTEVRILYTKHEVYFGVVCHDPLVGGPVATQLRRDVTQELDDYFEIVIDSRRDGRNAYVFQVNPLGTQRDALITDEQAGDTPRRRPRLGWSLDFRSPDSTRWLDGDYRHTVCHPNLRSVDKLLRSKDSLDFACSTATIDGLFVWSSPTRDESLSKRLALRSYIWSGLFILPVPPMMAQTTF